MKEHQAEKIASVLVAIYESKYSYFVLGLVMGWAVS